MAAEWYWNWGFVGERGSHQGVPLFWGVGRLRGEKQPLTTPTPFPNPTTLVFHLKFPSCLQVEGHHRIAHFLHFMLSLWQENHYLPPTTNVMKWSIISSMVVRLSFCFNWIIRDSMSLCWSSPVLLSSCLFSITPLATPLRKRTAPLHLAW